MQLVRCIWKRCAYFIGIEDFGLAKTMWRSQTFDNGMEAQVEHILFPPRPKAFRHINASAAGKFEPGPILSRRQGTVHGVLARRSEILAYGSLSDKEVRIDMPSA